MRLSLRYRLLLPLALLLAGDAAATAWAANIAARNAERQLAEQQWAIAHTLTEPRSTFPLTKPILEQMKGFSGAEFLFVPAGAVRAESSPRFQTQLSRPTSAVSSRQSWRRTCTSARRSRSAGANTAACGDAARAVPGSPGATSTSSTPSRSARPRFATPCGRLLVLGGLGGLLAVALAVAFGSRLVRRVRDLDARTRLIAAGDFRPMPVPESGRRTPRPVRSGQRHGAPPRRVPGGTPALRTAARARPVLRRARPPAPQRRDRREARRRAVPAGEPRRPTRNRFGWRCGNSPGSSRTCGSSSTSASRRPSAKQAVRPRGSCSIRR